MQDKFAQTMHTLYKRMVGFKSLDDFVRTSISLDKNNFHVYGNLSVHNFGPERSPFNGHIYHVEVVSKGYGHRTKLSHTPYSKVTRASMGSDNRLVIDWELGEKRMLENMEYAARTIRNISKELDVIAPIERTVNKINYGTPYSRFDDDPTGFIS